MTIVSISFIFSSLIISAYAGISELTLLPDAAEKDGAQCLDGSPPGYYFRRGATADNWIIFLEGGGWCFNEDDCFGRSASKLGSSTKWEKTQDFSNNGFLSDNKDINPDFYDWNSVFVPYCDGVSFTSDRTDPLLYKGKDLYFRGYRILQAVIKSLVNAAGLDKANRAILSGSSAGGLAVYYHLDYVRSLIPTTVDLKGLADAGYFIDAPNIHGEYAMRDKVMYAFKMHNTTSGENRRCVNNHPGNESACLAAPVVYPYISTPLFSLNSQYDTWQLENILEIDCNPANCNAEQIKEVENFRDEFMSQAMPIIQSQGNGAFLDSCLTHVQSKNDRWTSVTINNQSIASTFGDWYFQRNNRTKLIDCAKPECNKTC